MIKQKLQNILNIVHKNKYLCQFLDACKCIFCKIFILFYFLYKLFSYSSIFMYITASLANDRNILDYIN